MSTRERYCPVCGYNLRGVKLRCPECSCGYDARDRRTYVTDDQRKWTRRRYLAVWPMPVVIVLWFVFGQHWRWVELGLISSAFGPAGWACLRITHPQDMGFRVTGYLAVAFWLWFPSLWSVHTKEDWRRLSLFIAIWFIAGTGGAVLAVLSHI
jgi:hypothetical protein